MLGATTRRHTRLAAAVWAMRQLAAAHARWFVASLYSTASTAGVGFTSR